MTSSLGTVNAHHGAVNIVGHDQINQITNYQFYSVPGPENVSLQQGLLGRINDAPVDLLSVSFTGREKNLAFLHEALNKGRGDLPSRCAVYGMPGVGKTQLLLRYAKLSFDQHQYSHIFWISATTVDKLIQGFARILDVADPRGHYIQEQDMKLTSARVWLEGSHKDDTIRWLLVFDNVHGNALGFLRSHLPRSNPQGSILFSTRTAEVAEALVHAAGEKHPTLGLRVLDLRDTTRLLVEDAGIGEENVSPSLLSQAEDLVECVGRLPLAVAHAASFMKQTGTSLDGMLKLYNSECKIEVIQWENTLTSYERQSVAATFTNQFNQLNHESREASNLLKVLSFLDPEDIPLKMIVEGAQELSGSQDRPRPITSTFSASSSPPSLPKLTPSQKLKEGSPRSFRSRHPDTQVPTIGPPAYLSSESQSLISLILSPVQFQKAIRKLNSLSLVEHRSNFAHSSLHMHDLIPFMIRECARKEKTYREWLQLSVSLVHGVFRHIEDPELPQSWAEYEKFIPHFQSLNQAWNGMDGMNAELTDAKKKIAMYLRCHGRYEEAERLCKQVLAVKEKYLGADHLDTLSSMSDLAWVYVSQERYDEAERLLKLVLAGARHLGSGHPDTLRTVIRLAWVNSRQGRQDEAEMLFQRVLAIQERQLGAEHRDTLGTMSGLGLVYRSQGRCGEAEVLLKQALSTQERQLGTDHPDTFWSMSNLALVYQSQERYGEAGALLNLVLAGAEKHLGANHPNNFWIMNHLALVYQLQRRYDEAAALYKLALEGREKHLGSDHPKTMMIARHLANLRRVQGRAGGK